MRARAAGLRVQPVPDSLVFYVHRRSSNPGEGRRRRQRLPGLPAGEVRPARRPERRRRRPRRRRLPGGRPSTRTRCFKFRFNPEHKAERGRHGEGSNRTGADGQSIEVQVPVGTVVYDEATGERLFDFTEPGQRFLVARGGRGGKGNARFATSTHQAPTEHEPGPARRGEAPAPGAEAAGRCGPGGLSQRRQIHADLAHLGRPSQDRRLPVHHPGTEPGRGASWTTSAASWWPTFPA